MGGLDPRADAQRTVREALAESARVKLAVAEEQAVLVAEMAEVMVDALRHGGKLVFFGNGGSAADAQHLAAEFVGRFRRERRALAAISLGANSSIVTALGNDYGYEQVFAREVEALVTERDVVIGISTSGRSPNVLQAVELARAKGARCIGLTGEDGHQLAALCDLCLLVPSKVAARIQEVHIVVGHVLCELVDERLG